MTDETRTDEPMTEEQPEREYRCNDCGAPLEPQYVEGGLCGPCLDLYADPDPTEYMPEEKP